MEITMRASLSDKELRGTINLWREENYSIRAVGKRLGFSRNAIRHRLNKAQELNLLTDAEITTKDKRKSKGKQQTGTKPKKANSSNSSIRALKVAELIDQERLDQAKIVRHALTRLGVDECIYDDVFRRDLSINNDRWKEVRDSDEFLGFQVVLPNRKRVWCHPDARGELLGLDGVRGV
jgi:transposase